MQVSDFDGIVIKHQDFDDFDALGKFTCAKAMIFREGTAIAQVDFFLAHGARLLVDGGPRWGNVPDDADEHLAYVYLPFHSVGNEFRFQEDERTTFVWIKEESPQGVRVPVRDTIAIHFISRSKVRFSLS